MLIAGVSDIHSPKYLEDFISAMDRIPEPDLMLICGDIVYRGRHKEVRRVESIIESRISCPVIGCPGNEEYDMEEVKRYSEIIHFLQDEGVKLRIDGRTVGIVGSKGSLDEPTWWQKRNIPGIEEEYRRRVGKLKYLLEEMTADIKILMTHYAPTYFTLKGEKRDAFSMLGSVRIEEIIRETMPNLVIHGHAHRGMRYGEIATLFRNIPVYNVALPLNHRITSIEI